MKTLKTLLDHRGFYHHCLCVPILTLIALHIPYFIPLLILYIYTLFKHQKPLLIITALITIIITAHFLLKPFTPLISNTLNGQVIAHDVFTQKLTIKNNQGKYYVYYDEYLNDEITTGDIVNAVGQPSKKAPPLPGTFNYEHYLRSQNISDVLYAKTITLQSQHIHPNQLNEIIANYILTFDEASQPYLSMFILGSRAQLDPSVNTQVSRLGIAHLFAISGLHIAMISGALLFGLNQTNLKSNHKTIILTSFIILYMIMTGFTPSIMRAGSLLILLRLNKHYKLKFTPVDCLSLIGVTLLIINPYQLYHVGFQLTFLVSVTIILMHPVLKKQTKFIQSLLVSAVAFSVALPLTAPFQNGFSLLTIPLNLIAIPYTMFVLLPLTYITFLLPFFSSLHSLTITFFETTIAFIDNRLNVLLILVFPNWLSIFGYYLLFYCCVIAQTSKQFKKRLIILTSFITLLILLPYLNVKQTVTFLNVRGDSIIIKDTFHQCTILIDTGEKTPNQDLIKTLYHLGIRHLDIVFLSHNHYDHTGEIDAVIKHFSPKSIITNSNHQIEKSTNHTCGNIEYYIYEKDKMYPNENNNSLIMKVIINSDVYLFTGDIEEEREMIILEQLPQIDILKIPHHGSSTSSSESFLNAINPEIAIITVHANNRFNHPSPSIINRLTDLEIKHYRTDLNGSIEITYLFSKRQKISPQIP